MPADAGALTAELARAVDHDKARHPALTLRQVLVALDNVRDAAAGAFTV